MGALEAPQDKHGQEHRTGTSRAEQTDKGGHGGAGSSGGHGVARGSGGHGSAGSSGGHGRWSLWPWPRSPRPSPYSRNSFTPPPQKISLGKLGGIRSPLGLDTQNSTKQDRKALQGQTERTGHPTGTRSPPGLAWRLRLHLGMTRSQRPTQGPSATASISATRGQAARMASMATTRGAACPRRVSMDKTRHDGSLKCSCGHNKTDTRHSWP